MKDLKQYLTESSDINESLTPEQIVKEIERLKAENEKLCDEADELFSDYGDGDDDENNSFWTEAPDWVHKRNSQIWDQIADNDEKISKLHKQLEMIKRQNNIK